MWHENLYGISNTIRFLYAFRVSIKQNEPWTYHEKMMSEIMSEIYHSKFICLFLIEFITLSNIYGGECFIKYVW